MYTQVTVGKSIFIQAGVPGHPYGYCLIFAACFYEDFLVHSAITGHP